MATNSLAHCGKELIKTVKTFYSRDSAVFCVLKLFASVKYFLVLVDSVIYAQPGVDLIKLFGIHLPTLL
jgi:hypothetical protein